ncbi:hypothetical protein G3N95_27630 [Paraburkholderia sp. Tr-20389]|uniref:hypothetical protein n=1 Tax=Paraburkholderia sp. Tr-20389 TaxID=2703903 RepID=UPI0019812CA2|nr:hypothetical protein [Paraburkholderia sp. Tr-20389]MBN3756738.1 hypothetical protein [Paraburkholderia sp. Tr-20389]
MEEVFTSQSCAVARIMSARQAVLQQSDEVARLSSGDKAARIERLDRLLFDVRAGRTYDFTMPTAHGEVRIFVTPD